MLRLNKKFEYGLMALLYLGEHDQSSAASVREMSRHLHIPETLLSKLMQSIKNAGLVEAVHGNQGGYRLTRRLGEITLLDVSHILNGPIHVTECLDPSRPTCPVQPGCTIVTAMDLLNRRILGLFKETSLEHLAERKLA